MKVIMKITKILCLVLSIIVSTVSIKSSDESSSEYNHYHVDQYGNHYTDRQINLYSIDYNVAQIKDVIDIPTLHHLCQNVIRKDWNEKITQAFKLAEIKKISPKQIRNFEEILRYNKYLQDNYAIAHNINLPSIFEIKKYGQTICSHLTKENNQKLFFIACEYQKKLDHYEYKQSALHNLYQHAHQVLKIVCKNNHTENDLKQLKEILIASQKERHDMVFTTGHYLPSIFHVQDGLMQKIVEYVFTDDQAQILRIMLDNGLNLYESGKEGYTLLHEAISCNAVNCTTTILEYKKKFDANSFRQKIIDEQNNLDKSQLIHAYNNYGETALSYAVEDNDIDITKILLDHQADVNQPSYDSFTPLFFARNEIASLLLQAGANVNYLNCDDESALHYAARENQHQAIELMLAAGANINQINKNGKTPLFYAKQEQAHEAIAILIAAGGWITNPAAKSTHTYNLRSNKRKIS